MINVYGDTAIVIDAAGKEHWLSIENVLSIQKHMNNPKCVNLTWTDAQGHQKTVKVGISLEEAKQILDR